MQKTWVVSWNLEVRRDEMPAAIDVINRIMAKKNERVIFKINVCLHSSMYSMLSCMGGEDRHIYVYVPMYAHLTKNVYSIS